MQIPYCVPAGPVTGDAADYPSGPGTAMIPGYWEGVWSARGGDVKKKETLSSKISRLMREYYGILGC